jgi:cytochrome c553
MRIQPSNVFSVFLAVTAASGAFIAPALAGDAAAGRAKARAACQTCHGENGSATLAGVPNLSGQQKEYLVEQLRAYRSGSRRNEQMSIIAKPLTDSDIDNVAEWYSSMKVTVEMPK